MPLSNIRLKAGLVVLALLSLLAFAGCGGGNYVVPVSGPAYTLTDISNGRQDGATAINNAGDVLISTIALNEIPALLRSVRFALAPSARASKDSVPQFTYLYHSGKFTAINFHAPLDFNDRGDTVGYDGLLQNGVYSRVPSLGPSGVAANFSSYPRAINNAGQVVGTATDPNLTTSPASFGSYHAFLYQDGQSLDLGTLGDPAPGAVYSDSGALDINDSGQVVGASLTGTPIQHAFLWQNGKMTDLGTLGGDTSEARAINNGGQIVGSASTAGREMHAALWQNGQVQDLDTPGHTSQALSINDAGQVVGAQQVSSPPNAYPPTHAFVYRDGKMLDLNKQVVNLSGWTLVAATGINNQGQICGNGFYKGLNRAFLLTPR